MDGKDRGKPPMQDRDRDWQRVHHRHAGRDAEADSQGLNQLNRLIMLISTV
jgi:hypothetical protein